MSRFAIFLTFALIQVVVSWAQEPMFRSYPRPVKTKAIEELLDSRAKLSPLLANQVDLPEAVDNSKLIYFPPVLMQQGGSCAQASGIGYMFTYEINRLLGRDAKIGDNRFSYAFTWNFLNDGEDQGGFVEQGLYIAQQYGVMTDADFGSFNSPSFRWASGFEKYLNAMRYRADEILTIEAGSEQGIKLLKRYLYDACDGSSHGGIVTYASCSSDWTINNAYKGPSSTGYHSLLTKLASEGSHALTIVGYDDLVEYTSPDGELQKGAFIVCNTWGSGMHDNGRFYLPYYFFLHHESVPKGGYLDTNCTAVRVYTHDPKVVARVNMTYSSRDDINITCGFAMGRSATSASNSGSFGIFKNQGGDYKLAGLYTAVTDFEFAVDYTRKFTDIEKQNPARYFLNIMCYKHGSKQGDGKVNSLSIVDYRYVTPKVYNCSIPKEGIPLETGRNVFIVNTVPRFVMSASRCRLKVDNATTYIVRTADNKYKKLLFSKNPDGTINLKYEEI